MSETIEDVVKSLRDRAEGRRKSGKLLQIDDKMFDLLADRIEAAHKREVTVSKMETTTPTCDKSSQVGNAANIIEVLKNIKQEAENTCEYMEYPIAGSPGERGTCLVVPVDWIIDECNAALAKPKRNIDKINDYGEMVNAWNDYVYHHSDERFSLASFFVWLFDNAKGEKQ